MIEPAYKLVRVELLYSTRGVIIVRWDRRALGRAIWQRHESGSEEVRRRSRNAARGDDVRTPGCTRAEGISVRPGGKGQKLRPYRTVRIASVLILHVPPQIPTISPPFS